ncbi:hypothetical protein [Derxia gummosa]|uniref:Uncharacterized protein n=1 Tax=Derxia gummosa DSM 723 TaxID=1121388 RepID=A0A8B6X6D5_9BURK|nr:hypothetical protein [Derxia gummosa]
MSLTLTRQLLLGLALAGALVAPAAQAFESFALYDDFNDSALDATRWPGGFGERIRGISSGRLRLFMREHGDTGSNVGYAGYTFAQRLPDPAAVNELKATITVKTVESVGCAGNASATSARARIYGDFFNTGARTAGSQLNDVSAQVRVKRDSDTSDAAGVLRVEGILLICGDASCNTSTTIGKVALGTAALGEAVKVRLQWDKTRNRFLFGRDGTGATSGYVSYTVSDATAPGVPLADVSTRLQVANCPSGDAVAAIDAYFDNLYVNSSAAP